MHSNALKRIINHSFKWNYTFLIDIIKETKIDEFAWMLCDTNNNTHEKPITGVAYKSISRKCVKVFMTCLYYTVWSSTSEE